MISADEKINIMLESIKTDISITELCRKYGISVSQFYKWKDQLFIRSVLQIDNARSVISLADLHFTP
ncbi:MAG: transposase [Thermoplasmata archaeon]